MPPLVTRSVLPLLLLISGPLAAQTDQVAALREGNRLFREGRIEEAYDTYLSGCDAARPHPVLYYNLGTAAHHLDRLPEAILWYRRAQAVNPSDPWLQDNLEIARSALGLQTYPVPGPLAAAAGQARVLYYLAALIAWVGAARWIVRSRPKLHVTLPFLAAALLIYAGGLGASRFAPRAAVLVKDCSDTNGDLPAGSEVWILEAGEGAVKLGAGSSTITCPPSAVKSIDSAD